jgi:geranylgeranyl pyrophosphate synthase
VRAATQTGAEAQIGAGLAEVRRLMAERVVASPLGDTTFDTDAFLATGKMLRARATLRLGAATAVPPGTLCRAAAAVELAHAATLLHDDVIDGGRLRRGAPAFWVANGVQAAILVGDLMLCEAFEVLRPGDPGPLAAALIELTSEVCRAEVEQELVRRGSRADWATGVAFARRKTGSLFAFAALAAAGSDAALGPALREAGYLAGTAYQVSDDFLDDAGDAGDAGKTLGSDAARRKITAASAVAGRPADPAAFLGGLRDRSADLLAPWPGVLAAWSAYWDSDLGPAIGRNLAGPGRRSP